MEITKVTAATFQSEVLNSPVPVLVDFTAVWCGPCKMLDPIVQQLAQEWNGKVKVFKLDIDEEEEIPLRYQVMSIPTLILFIGGQPVERLFGYQPKSRVAAKFSSYL